MNELETVNRTLPDTLPELSKFVLIGREKLNAVRAEIRAIEKVGLAKEVLEQKRVEAQEIAELVTMSEMKIGRMMKEIPKASGRPEIIVTKDKNKTPKSETIRELGFTPKQTAQFQQMADHEPQVLEAIAEARERDDIVSRADVMRKIETVKKPHVTNNSKDDEWYTPAKYIESAREVLGRIDLDPASNDFANKTVKADRYFTEESNGLEQEWSGNIWMNPPYLVNNATETAWFEKMISKASAIVFHKGRIRFVKRDGEHGAPLQGQAFIYYGDNAERFLEVFSKYGWGARL